MTARMFGYSDPFGLDSEELAPYRTSVHLCATTSLCEGIHKYYRNERGFFTGALLSVGDLLRNLLGEWSWARTNLRQFAQLSERMEVLSDGETDEGRLKRLRAFRRNQVEVLKTMRTLTEIGVDISRVEAAVQTEDERFFVTLWRWMEHNGHGFRGVRDYFSAQLQNADEFQKVLREALVKCKDVKQAEIPIKICQVVLHGFYFITPIQHRLFSLMQSAGIELVFLNLYDERYQKTFCPIRAFIEDWVPYDEWEHLPVKEQTHLTTGEWFASLYESDNLTDEAHHPDQFKLEAFPDFHSFLREYCEHPNGRDGIVEYYSPDNQSLNDRIKEYFPELFEDRHLLAYPIGQFLLHLHKMWNEVRRELILDERSLFECFASGWLQIGQFNSRQYIKDLKDLIPYFQGCQTYQEWDVLMEELMDIRRNLKNDWPQTEPIDNTITGRFHGMMGEPLLRFSFLNTAEDRLLTITRLIRRLWELAHELFGKSNARRSLTEHFAKIERMLISGVSGDTLLHEERAALERLRNELKAPHDEEEQYLVQDLAVAISLYLSGVFDGDGDQTRMIRSFDHLDGVPFLEGRDIHVCGLSEASLPRAHSNFSWPLTRTLLEQMEDLPEIQMMMLRDQFEPEFARYLFYHLLAFTQGPVTLSWIRDWECKQLEESVYVKVLGLDLHKQRERQEMQPNVTRPVIQRDFASASRELAQYPNDAKAEHEKCPRRFLLSFLVQPFATYREDFHHQFLIGAMFMTYQELTDREENEAFEQIHKLFPLWSDLKLKDIQLRAGELRDRVIEAGSDRYDGVMYPRLRKQFQFLKPVRGLEAFRENYDFVTALERDQQPLLRAQPSDDCKYCPHLVMCKDGLNPIDEDEITLKGAAI